jgi:hypothetical protein
MAFLSDKTLGLLIETGSKKMTASHIKTLMMQTEIFQYGSREDNKEELLRSRLMGARAAADDGDDEARRAMLSFVEGLVQKMMGQNPFSSDWMADLQERLRADGLDIQATVEGKPGRTQRRYQLLPTEPAPVALPREITALEGELAARGYTIALNHYQHAVDGLVNKKYESANGDLRAALEDLVTRLAEDHAGYQRAIHGKTGQPSANQGGRAVRHLIDGGHIPEMDGGKLLDGLWSMTHTNGSHPGQSDAEEARFRMQVVTAVARFVLKHFPATAGSAGRPVR